MSSKKVHNICSEWVSPKFLKNCKTPTTPIETVSQFKFFILNIVFVVTKATRYAIMPT